MMVSVRPPGRPRKRIICGSHVFFRLGITNVPIKFIGMLTYKIEDSTPPDIAMELIARLDKAPSRKHFRHYIDEDLLAR